MKFTRDDVATLTDILNWRRDVRHFKRTDVPAELLEALKAAMDHAPSVGNARPWRVLQVDDQGLRAQVANNFITANAQATELYEDDRRRQYDALKLAGLDAAPVQLAVFTDMSAMAGHGLGRQTMPETLVQSTSMAIYALWLVARAHNLGLGMVSILSPEKIERLFDVPKDWAFSAYLCIGWPEFDDDTPLLHRAGWQKDQASWWQTR